MSIANLLRISCYPVFCIFLSSSTLAINTNYPAWWCERGMVDTNAATAGDFAPLLAGQLKWFATNAFDELNQNLLMPDGSSAGAGQDIETLVAGFGNSNNYAIVNLGQLKHVASLFYDRFNESSNLTCLYPWGGIRYGGDDFKPANVGQMKNLFSFDLREKRHFPTTCPAWWDPVLLQGKQITPWAVFEPLPEQTYSGATGAIVLSATLNIGTFIPGWDRFYLSSLAAEAGGWKTKGLKIAVNGHEYNFLTNDSIDVTDAIAPDEPVHIALIYTGGGIIAMDARVILPKWTPNVIFGLSPTDLSGNVFVPVYKGRDNQTAQLCAYLDSAAPSRFYDIAFHVFAPDWPYEVTFNDGLYAWPVHLTRDSPWAQATLEGRIPSYGLNSTRICAYVPNMIEEFWSTNLTVFDVAITDYPETTLDCCGNPMYWRGPIKLSLLPEDPNVAGTLAVMIGDRQTAWLENCAGSNYEFAAEEPPGIIRAWWGVPGPWSPWLAAYDEKGLKIVGKLNLEISGEPFKTDKEIWAIDRVTKLYVSDPGVSSGTVALVWSNPPGQQVKLNGADSSVELDCNTTTWPVSFDVTIHGTNGISNTWYLAGPVRVDLSYTNDLYTNRCCADHITLVPTASVDAVICDLPEEKEESPGGFAPFNSNDDNTNGIPDFADGYGLLWTPRVTTNEHFTELTITLPDFVKIGEAILTISYVDSDPLLVVTNGPPEEWQPAPGMLRLWTTNGCFQRSGTNILAADISPDTGYFVSSNRYDGSLGKLQKLGFGDQNHSVTLYVEGVRSGAGMIDVKLEPCGLGRTVALDRVKATAPMTALAMPDVISANTDSPVHLAPMVFGVDNGGISTGVVELAGLLGSEKIRILTGADTPVSLPAIWDLSLTALPGDLRIEGVSPSASEGDVRLRVRYIAPCGVLLHEMWATTTVHKVDIEGTNIFICGRETNAVVSLTSDSYWGGPGHRVRWEFLGPMRFGGYSTNREFMFNASIRSAGVYVVQARDDWRTSYDSATVTIYRVQISDGTLPDLPPAEFISIGQTQKYQCVVTPDLPGQYEWAITNGATRAAIVGSVTGKVVLVEGLKSSVTNGDVVLQLRYKREGSSVWCSPTNTAISIVAVDLDLDSDNNNGLGLPSRNRTEDGIEDTPDLPGKMIALNVGDQDEDGVPNFADGIDKWGNSGTNAGGGFTPLVFELIGPIDPAKALVRFVYPASPPDGVTRTGAGTPADPYVYAPAEGALRIWKVDGTNDRKVAEISAGGDFVNTSTVYAATSFGPGKTNVVYIEGIRNSSEFGDQQIRIEIDPDGDGRLGWLCADQVRCTVIGPDLDVDSDNDNGYAPPDRSDREDQIEDMTNRVGKALSVNDGDEDRDGVPDWADGFDILGTATNSDDVCAGLRFVPVVLEIPKPIDISVARLRLTYPASDPAKVKYNAKTKKWTLPQGYMRLWKKDGGVARNKANVAGGGDYIPPDIYTDLSLLGFSTGQRTSTVWVESVRITNQLAGLQLKIEVDPDGKAGSADWICTDDVRFSTLKVELDGLRVYDPKLENAGSAEIKYKINGPATLTPRVELTIMDGGTEVACLVFKTDPGPTLGTEISKDWNGRWGKKKDGTDTANKDKFADPKKYTLELNLYESGTAFSPIFTTVYDLHVVRLGVIQLGFLDDQDLVYHKTTTNDTENFTFADNSAFANDVVWKLEHLDFVKPAGISRTEVRKEQTPTGESYTDTDNVLGRTGTEQYFDEDGNGAYTPGTRQANFPPQKPMANKDISAGVENDRYNRPAVYVRGKEVKVWLKMGDKAKSDVTLADCGVGYPTTVPTYPIWIVGKYGGTDMGNDTSDPETGTGVAIRSISPANGPYKLKSTSKLVDTVGVDTETVEFTFKYNKRGESFVDADGNGLYDAGETLINDNGNGTFDAEWQDIPGKQTTTHLIYRLADSPNYASMDFSARTGEKLDRLFMKIVDFTCTWGQAAGAKTAKEVLDSYWNNGKFWTPFVPDGAPPTLRPDNPNGFKGTGDPTEKARIDAWGNSPMCYTYRHDLGAGQTVNGWLDDNYARCGGWSPVLRTFMATHGLASDEQIMPAMKWRFVSNAGNVSFEDYATAENHKNAGKRPGGAVAQTGDVWYKPLGIWVGAHGQTNPYFTCSPHLLSFWVTGAGNTDHVFLKYNGRYYDGSYEHAVGANYATINSLADTGVSFYYYDAKWTCDAAGTFQNTTGTMPLERIWYPVPPINGWSPFSPMLKVPQDATMDEMQEP